MIMARFSSAETADQICRMAIYTGTVVRYVLHRLIGATNGIGPSTGLARSTGIELQEKVLSRDSIELGDDGSEILTHR